MSAVQGTTSLFELINPKASLTLLLIHHRIHICHIIKYTYFPIIDNFFFCTIYSTSLECKTVNLLCGLKKTSKLFLTLSYYKRYAVFVERLVKPIFACAPENFILTFKTCKWVLAAAFNNTVGKALKKPEIFFFLSCPEIRGDESFTS